MSADTQGKADAAKPPRADHVQPAEPDRAQSAEHASPRQQADAGRSSQPGHTLNRADYNAARHAEPPIRRYETAGGERRDDGNRQSAGREPEDVTGSRVARKTAAERAAAGNPDHGDPPAEGKTRTSEHSPNARPAITHLHAEFKGQTTDLYTDGTRWASGDIPRSENVSVGRGEIPDRPPSGEELVDSADEESSRAERLRREIYEEGDDLVDVVDNNTNAVHDIFSQPPTGSYEVASVEGPHFSTPQHSGMDVGTGATALFALGLAIDRVATWTMRHWEKHSEGD